MPVSETIVTQEFHLSGGKSAFTWIDCQAIVLQHLEELGKMIHMLFQGAACNQMVVQVSENKREVAEQTVH